MNCDMSSTMNAVKKNIDETFYTHSIYFKTVSLNAYFTKCSGAILLSCSKKLAMTCDQILFLFIITLICDFIKSKQVMT